MAHDQALTRRVRDLLAPIAGAEIDERAMFGGLAYLDRGHMFCGILGAELMVRVGPAAYAEALGRPHARPMDFTGRPLTGFVYVAAPGIAGDEELWTWIGRGLAFTRSMPAKTAAPRVRKPRPRGSPIVKVGKPAAAGSPGRAAGSGRRGGA
jgi:TfoX/Sxy family transcriptional regulator of competence genes